MTKKFATICSVLAVMALGVNSALAGMVMFTSNIALQSTNWDEVIADIPEFSDTLPGVPSGSVLTKVTVMLTGDIAGTARYESLDAAATVVELNLEAIISLTTPVAIMDVVVQPVANVMDNATAFDGSNDFNGSSGGTFADLNGQEIDMKMYNSLADLALFSGVGFLNLPVTADGTSSGTGGGNLVTQFITDAGAEVKVIYDFRTNDIPEPASALLLGLGCVALLNRPKRRQAA